MLLWQISPATQVIICPQTHPGPQVFVLTAVSAQVLLAYVRLQYYFLCESVHFKSINQ